MITTAFNLMCDGIQLCNRPMASSCVGDLSVIDIYLDTQRARIRSYINPFSSAKTELKLDFTEQMQYSLKIRGLKVQRLTGAIILNSYKEMFQKLRYLG